MLIYKKTYDFQKENLDSSETVNFFVKTLPYESKQLLDLIVEGGVFAEEQDFYEKLVPELTKSYTAEKWSPKCYLVKSGTIVLEDLRSQGYKRRAQTFDDPTVLKSALTSIARFHGCGIAAETRLVKRSSQVSVFVAISQYLNINFNFPEARELDGLLPEPPGKQNLQPQQAVGAAVAGGRDRVDGGRGRESGTGS